MTDVHIDRRALLMLARLLAFRAAVGLLLGAVDALVTAWLGVPRLSRFSHQFIEVVRTTWEEQR